MSKKTVLLAFVLVLLSLLTIVKCAGHFSTSMPVQTISKLSKETSTVIHPIADTYVDSQYHWENKRSSDILAVWNGYTKYVSFLKFDVSSLNSSKIISAMLFLRVVVHSVESNQTSILGVHFYNESWNEDELTWDTVNWSGLNETAIDTTEIYLDLLEHQVWFNWTITQDVQSSVGSFLTEVVKAENDIESIFFSSRETSYVPYLNITYIKLPVHNIDTGLNYTTIQEAIDAPETLNRNTILVDNGTYYEHVVVDKAVSLIGENKHTTIIDGSGKTVVSLKVNDTKIKGFTVQDGPNGILMFPWTHGHIISSNIVLNNEYGIAGHYDCASVIICDNIITLNNITGIEMLFSHSVISNNLISDNGRGEFQEYSSGIQIVKGVNSKVVYCVNNTIFGNTIKNHRVGIWAIQYSEENLFFHNNFINNTRQVDGTMSNDTWDDSYPSGGNYWSSYNETDQHSGQGQDQPRSDGLGDNAYMINGNNIDRFPLMAPISIFDAGTWNDISYSVDVVSNSTVSDFYFNPDESAFLRFDVMGENGTLGFCRVIIPKDLLWVEDGWKVYLTWDYCIVQANHTTITDENCTYMYFTYNQSRKTVEIQGTHVIPEFPSFLILPLFMIATLLTVVFYKRKHTEQKS